MSLPILRKEFRYRAGGLLALPALLVAGGWSVDQLARMQDQSVYGSILSPVFAGGPTLICAIVGLGCGLWQALPETRPASWAFLRHRPISPTRLFFGKLLAALLIYLLVTGVPSAWVIWWAQHPGHFFGPWLWPMAVPLLVDLLCGTVYVLAGMLAGLREARWFGSRLLPVGLAIVCSTLSWLPWLWVALLAIAGAWAILLPAAWTAMISRGRESRQPLTGRALTAVTLLPAMVAIPMLVGAVVGESMRPRATAAVPTTYYMQGNAELYETSYQDGVSAYRRVVDEKGVLRTDAPYAADRLQRSSVSLVIDWNSAGYAPAPSQRPYRDAGTYLISQESGYTGEMFRERWCYLREASYIVGYSCRAVGEAQVIGYLGANGFAASPADVVPFQVGEALAWVGGHYLDLIVEPGQVLKVDLSRREVPTIFTAPQGEHAMSAGRWQLPLSTPDTYRTLYAVATDKATYVLDEHQKVLLRQEHIGPVFPRVSVSASPDLKTFGLLYSRDVRLWGLPEVFLRVSADGTILTRTDVPDIRQRPGLSRPSEAVIGSVALPPVLSVFGVIHDKPQAKLHLSPWLFFPPMAICAGVSLAIALWLLRRAGERRGWTLFWLITVLLLGISGVMLMLAMRQWPPRVRCGHCGRKSITTAFACQHCGKQFPIPDPGPIEIRDDVAAPSFSAS